MCLLLFAHIFAHIAGYIIFAYNAGYIVFDYIADQLHTVQFISVQLINQHSRSLSCMLLVLAQI